LSVDPSKIWILNLIYKHIKKSEETRPDQGLNKQEKKEYVFILKMVQ
jgi:hypothetical protein